jgi:hypothetical protein
MKAPLLCILLAACGCAAKVDKPALRVEASRTWGATSWNCKDAGPIIFYRHDVVENADLYAEVEAHEKMHVAQMYRLGCKGWNQRWKSQAFRDTMEAEASCAQWQVAKHRRKPAPWAFGAKYNPEVTALLAPCLK